MEREMTNIQALQYIIAMLTRERRVVFATREESQTMVAHVNNRDYGRVLGKRAANIADINCIGKAIGIGVELAREGTNDESRFDVPENVSVSDILCEVIDMIDQDAEIDIKDNGDYEVKLSTVNHQLQSAINRIFYAIGLNERQMCKVIFIQ
jgi:predicted RNA-binding protein YlqC (UPF0109 family)